MASQTQMHERNSSPGSASQTPTQVDDPQAVAAARALLVLHEEDKARMKAATALLNLWYWSREEGADPVEEEDGNRDRDEAQEEDETQDRQETQGSGETEGEQETPEGLETEEEDWSNPIVLDYWRKRR